MPPPVGRLASIAAVALGALASAAPALADNAGLTPVDPKSPNAEAINDTYYLLLGVTGVVFFAVEIALVVFLIRYRRRNRPVDAEGPQIHGNTRLEVLWTIVPVFLVAIVVGFVFYKLPAVTDVTRAASEPADEPNLVIDVEGQRFYWEFRYPDGRITYDTMVVPVDRTVELNVTAPDFDVIHSWWIPALGGKIDAIPGKLNHTWFRAESSGDYEGNCAEFCGLQHAEMTMIVRAVDAGEIRSGAHAPRRKRAGAVRGDLREVPQRERAATRRPDARRQPDARRPRSARDPPPRGSRRDAGDRPRLERRAARHLFAYTRGVGGEQ